MVSPVRKSCTERVLINKYRAFLVQVPPTLAALTMVAIALKLPAAKSTDKTQSNWDRVKRIDFAGAFFLGATILSLCLILDLGGTRLPWSSSWIYVLIGTTLASAIVFIISAKRAAEPIFPLELATHYVVVTNYLVILCQTTAQSALMISVPLYFQVTAAASTSEAGAHLIPAFAGNTIGGLMAGYWIKRSGYYKPLTVLSPIMGVLCTTTLLLAWDGHTSPWLSLLIFPGGLAMGIISSSAFVGLAAGVNEEGIAVTTSGMFLAFNIGSIAGVSGGSAVLQNVLRSSLGKVLDGLDGGEEIMQRALADIGYVQTAGKAIRDLLIPAYVIAFHSVNGKLSIFPSARDVILTTGQCSALCVHCLRCLWRQSVGAGGLSGRINELSNSVETKKWCTPSTMVPNEEISVLNEPSFEGPDLRDLIVVVQAIVQLDNVEDFTLVSIYVG
jgi:hypothetical protein